MISKRSKAYRSAQRREDYHAVCLIGWEGPRPARFGDNRGIWPVRVAISKKEMKANQHADLETPHVGVVVLEYVLVPTEEHAKRLKEALDEVLLGQQEAQENTSLRGKWRDLRDCWEEHDEEGRHLFWITVLEDAQRLLRRSSTSFQMYTADEAYKKISKRALRR